MMKSLFWNGSLVAPVLGLPPVLGLGLWLLTVEASAARPGWFLPLLGGLAVLLVVGLVWYSAANLIALFKVLGNPALPSNEKLKWGLAWAVLNPVMHVAYLYHFVWRRPDDSASPGASS